MRHTRNYNDLTLTLYDYSCICTHYALMHINLYIEVSFSYFSGVLMEKTADSHFRNNVKDSFQKVKEDILTLKSKIKENKELISLFHEQIDLIRAKLDQIDAKLDKETSKSQLQSKDSKGSNGVYSFIHSFNKHSFTPKITSFTDIKTLDKTLLTLRKQEFLVFLIIYQLEEDLNKPLTYKDLSDHTKLSEGCIRMYVSNIIKARLPVIKQRINNKIVVLSIAEEFRSLNIKSHLLTLYNRSDPSQRTLTGV